MKRTKNFDKILLFDLDINENPRKGILQVSGIEGKTDIDVVKLLKKRAI